MICGLFKQLIKFETYSIKIHKWYEMKLGRVNKVDEESTLF